MRYHPSLIQRFVSKIKITDTCWLWIGAKTEWGYGILKVPNKNKNHKAHRFSYQIFRGPIPTGMCVLHTCDTPNCVNPSHLKIGTFKENTHDMMRKGRGGGQFQKGHRESNAVKLKRANSLKGNQNALGGNKRLAHQSPAR